MHRYGGRLYGKGFKTRNAKRTVELHATFCATLREIRPVKLHQHSVVFTTLRGEPIRPGAFSELWYDSESWTRRSGRGLYHNQAHVLLAHRVVGRPHRPYCPTTPRATRRGAIGARDGERSGRTAAAA